MTKKDNKDKERLNKLKSHIEDLKRIAKLKEKIGGMQRLNQTISLSSKIDLELYEKVLKKCIKLNCTPSKYVRALVLKDLK